MENRKIDEKKIDEEEIKNLEEKIEKYNEAYEAGIPLVEDTVYDFYKKKLRILEEQQHKEIKISEKIGPKPKKGIKHIEEILSLEHDFGKEKIEENVNRIKKKLKEEEIFPMIGEIKIDGVSIVARYENGDLKSIATRGDGKEGEDISELKEHLSIPDKIEIKEKLEIRFEAYIKKTKGENGRNIVAGLLMQKRASRDLKKIKFAAHNIYSKERIWNTYEELREKLEKMHIETVKPYRVCKNEKEMEEFFEEIEKTREEIECEIDGIVFKINSKDQQERLGNTAKGPKYAFAIKFESEYAITEIKEITYQVGRTGKITPIAEIQEVKLKGSSVKRATLHNMVELKKKQYSKKDIIKVEMAGEVIPYISEIIEKRGEKEEYPTTCPKCGKMLENDICTNEWECIGQRIERLEYFARKEGLNIKGMGTKQIEYLAEEGLVKYPQDFFEIKNKVQKMKKPPKWLGEKGLKNLLDGIEKSRYTTIEKWYNAIGLPNIGKTKAEILGKKYENFEEFLKASKEELEFLGPTISEEVVKYKEKETWLKEAYKQMKIGEEFKEEELPLFIY